MAAIPFDPEVAAAVAAVDITSMPRYLQHGYPWADWDLLREVAPVYRYEGRPRFSPFWAVTRYADVRHVSSRPDLFSNRGVVRLDTDSGLARLTAYRRKRAERHGWDPDVALDMLYTDRPEHLDLRSLSARRFTPRAMGRLEAQLDGLAQEFVDRFVAKARAAAPDPVDLVEHLSVGLPLATICGLLGLPVDDWPTIRRWSDQTLLTPDMSHPDVRPGESPADVRRRAGQEYHAYRQALIQQARSRPAPDDDEPDLVGRLAHASIDGRPLDDQHFHGYLELLVGGGNETTRNTITGGVRALLQHPDQIEVLAADPDGVIETATEELLRWVSPVIQFARTATVDTELGGQRIEAGDTVVLWYPRGPPACPMGAGNRRLTNLIVNMERCGALSSDKTLPQNPAVADPPHPTPIIDPGGSPGRPGSPWQRPRARRRRPERRSRPERRPGPLRAGSG